MQGMFFVPAAVLRQLDLILQLLFVPLRVVIDVLADGALQLDEIILRHA